MSKILIFAGTTEGRELAELLSYSGVACDVSVATQYGEHMMEDNENLTIMCKRLNADEMRQLYEKNEYVAVIDATHPYATEVTRTIKESLEGFSIMYLRMSRDEMGLHNFGKVYESVRDCAETLRYTEGNILLTTGSKELCEFAKYDDLRERIYARVIPSQESLRICHECGVMGNRIIAMQGPFSEEMNIAIIRQYGIKHLVSKLSGREGGENDKISAAIATGIETHLINRPSEINDITYSKAQILEKIESLANTKISKPKINVNLVGIGCGNPKMMTVEALECIDRSDYIFGASRMLASVNSNATKYPYYTADNVVPMIKDIYDNCFDKKEVSILFSGDTGFYSGCKNMCRELEAVDYVVLKICPGISSIQALSAACRISYEDASIISAHGSSDDASKERIIESAKRTEKTFFLTSGISDLFYIGDKLSCLEGMNNVKIYIGYNLSYDDERVICTSPCECRNDICKLPDKGLYVGAIINGKYHI